MEQTTSSDADQTIAIDWQAFAQEPGKGILPQVSAPDVIGRLVAYLDVHQGQQVLEIGTGSGYSAAVLGVAVGPRGSVTSIELVPELVTRARGSTTRASATSNCSLETVAMAGPVGAFP